MEYRFQSDEWRNLTPRRKPQDLANGAEPKLASSYLRIAEEWLKLADDIERAPVDAGTIRTQR